MLFVAKRDIKWVKTLKKYKKREILRERKGRGHGGENGQERKR